MIQPQIPTPTITRSAKQVAVLARFQFKDDRRKVVYLVQSNSNKVTYHTSFYAGKAVGCTCPAHKPCYHMTQLEAIEATRSIQPVTITATPLIHKHDDLSIAGKLNTSRAFSLMR